MTRDEVLRDAVTPENYFRTYGAKIDVPKYRGHNTPNLLPLASLSSQHVFGGRSGRWRRRRGLKISTDMVRGTATQRLCRVAGVAMAMTTTLTAVARRGGGGGGGGVRATSPGIASSRRSRNQSAARRDASQ